MDKVKRWFRYAFPRAVGTMGAAFITLVGTETVSITDLDWPRIFGVCLMSGLVTLVKCLVISMPEMNLDDEEAIQ